MPITRVKSRPTIEALNEEERGFSAAEAKKSIRTCRADLKRFGIIFQLASDMEREMREDSAVNAETLRLVEEKVIEMKDSQKEVYIHLVKGRKLLEQDRIVEAAEAYEQARDSLFSAGEVFRELSKIQTGEETPVKEKDTTNVFHRWALELNGKEEATSSA